MPVGTRTVAQTSDQKKSFEIAVQACKDEENKCISLKQKVQVESNRLSILLKLLQQHQAKLKATNDHDGKDPTSTKRWFGPLLPPRDSVHSLCQILNQDLETTEFFTGCTIEQCNVVLFPESKDEIKRRYDATGKVENIEFDLQLESVFQVLKGEERVSRVIDVIFRPPLPELQPLQRCLQQTSSSYILPRALRTIQDIERDQNRICSWAVDRQRLEIASDTRLSFLLSYVGRHGESSSSPRRGTRAKRTALKREKDLSSCSESDSPRKSQPRKNSSLQLEDDMTVKLGWDIKFCDQRKNFLSNFELVVSDAVLVRYSQSSAQPLLAKTKKLYTGNDVIELFSIFSH